MPKPAISSTSRHRSRSSTATRFASLNAPALQRRERQNRLVSANFAQTSWNCPTLPCTACACQPITRPWMRCRSLISSAPSAPRALHQLPDQLPPDRAVVDGAQAILQVRQAIQKALGRLRLVERGEGQRDIAQLLAEDAQAMQLRIGQFRPALAQLHQALVAGLQQTLGEIAHRRIQMRPSQRVPPRAVMQTLEQLQLHRGIARIVQRLDRLAPSGRALLVRHLQEALEGLVVRQVRGHLRQGLQHQHVQIARRAASALRPAQIDRPGGVDGVVDQLAIGADDRAQATQRDAELVDRLDRAGRQHGELRSLASGRCSWSRSSRTRSRRCPRPSA